LHNNKKAQFYYKINKKSAILLRNNKKAQFYYKINKKKCDFNYVTIKSMILIIQQKKSTIYL